MNKKMMVGGVSLFLACFLVLETIAALPSLMPPPSQPWASLLILPMILVIIGAIVGMGVGVALFFASFGDGR